MDVIKKIFTNSLVAKTAIILAAILIITLLAHAFASRYNRGYSKRNLFFSRACIAIAIVLLVAWFLGLI